MRLKRAGKPTDKPTRGGRRYSRTPVTTYYRSESAAQSQSPFQRKAKPKNTKKYLLGAADTVLIVVLLAVFAYSLVVSPDVHVSATNSTYHSPAQYAAAISGDFRSLQDRNKITFNEAKVAQAIRKQFPEVSGASIELPFLSEQPNVRLVISPPAFKLINQGVAYVIDRDGVAVEKDTGQAKYGGLVSVDDQSGFQASSGHQVISAGQAGFIDTVIKQSRRANVPIKSMTLPASPLEIDLRTTDQPYYVKFYLNGDADTQTGQFLAARHKFSQAHIVPSQYLDVRVQGKIFYK